MQIIAVPGSGRVNLNVREGGYLKYSLFVFSAALLKLFWNYFDVWLPFSYPAPIFLPRQVQSFTHRGWHLQRRGRWLAVMLSEPLPGRVPPSSYILFSSLWSWERYLKPLPTLQSPCLCVAPLSMCYRIEGP